MEYLGDMGNLKKHNFFIDTIARHGNDYPPSGFTLLK
jgi:hypothetical protein